MLKKIILGVVIILVVLLATTGFLYAKGNDSPKIKKADQVEDEEINQDINVFHITSSCNNGGTISPKGMQSVENGKSIDFIVTAKDGYKIEWVRIDNAKIKSITSNTYTKTFIGDGKNHTIHAQFKKIKTNSNRKNQSSD
jgi:hypothetical protein